MRKFSRSLVLPVLLITLSAASPAELARWKAQAQAVTITRDDWGIAHIHGPTDADAVFGMIYAQAEDDFPRIEANYLTALGRKAEAEGEKAIWEDLRARLYVSDQELKASYAQSPPHMQRLMDAWAAGLNYYLATHRQVRPRVLHRFEPWMVLSFTEGSIGGDIEQIDLKALEAFYGLTRKSGTARAERTEDRGSNGIAIAPALTRDGKALLLINPHTSYFFRSEQQVTSDEGLNVYGASTWGQFFTYQGFNERIGWMHTSSGVDVIDEFAETIAGAGTARCYRYGNSCRPLTLRPVTIRYRTKGGQLQSRDFTTYRTHHGPIVRSDGDRWIAFSMMNRPVEALQQSYLRTRATDFESFMKIAQLKANSSNNTIYADAAGVIAYLHPQFVPRRDNRFDYTRPVDGSIPATEWGSLHSLSELPNVINPPNGWVQNTNAWPYRAAGEFSPNPVRYPKYMDMFGENFRGLHAIKLLTGSRGWTVERLNAAAYDNHQPGFAALIPALLKAYDDLPKSDPRRVQLFEPIATLRSWNFRWSGESIPQSLAMFWVDDLLKLRPSAAGEPRNITDTRLSRRTSPQQKLHALQSAIARLQSDFGRWQVPWGEINRFQRISSAIDQPFDDSQPSTSIPYPSGRWGSLASHSSSPKPGTKRWYQSTGNTFVAVVEFGPRLRARAVREGGQSGDPESPHFNDQALRHAAGALREVYFYPDQLRGHTKRVYKPGE